MAAGVWFRNNFSSVLAPAAASLLAVTVPTALILADRSGVELPGASSVKDFLSMLDARSPGERSTGELSQTKSQKMAERGPSERALGRINQARNGPSAFERAVTQPEASPIVDALPADQLAKAIVPAEAGIPVPVIGGGIIPGGLGGGGVIGGGGGGGGGGGVTNPVITPTELPTVPTAAVPEPETWLTMLIGFAGMGVTMRRRRTGLLLTN